jgi:hypothetical protein
MKSSDLAQTEFHDEGPYNKYLVLLVWKKWGRGQTSNRASVLKLTMIRNPLQHDDAEFFFGTCQHHWGDKRHD